MGVSRRERLVLLEVSHRGVPLGHTDLVTEGLAIGDFRPGDGYAKVRDVIREASRAVWAMGFFRANIQPRVAVEDIAAAARLEFELRDEKGALVHSDWVNIIALTPDQHIVLVRQFRFGINAFSLEIPGGMIDAGEDPIVAGLRELREETGFVGGSARVLAATGRERR